MATEIRLDVAILGGGFAGIYCAKQLEREFGRASGVKVGLISEENHMVFQPMLPEVVSASISPRHVVNPIRLLCPRTHVHKGSVEEIRWPERTLIFNGGDFLGRVEVRYERLVLALGSVVDLSRVPGMPEHAFLMRNVGDAMLLRATILGRLEEANFESRPGIKDRLLTFVIVGGGYSGVETAGQIADFFKGVEHHYRHIHDEDLQVVLVHSRDHLLPTLSRKLSEYTARKLQGRGVRLLLNQRVKSITASRVYLEDGSTIETNTVISTVGNAPHPLVSRLCEQNGFESNKGRIKTLPSCQVQGIEGLWAAGDCAAVPMENGEYCPTTAQFALRQGTLLGRNLCNSLRKKPPEPFKFNGFGEMATIGHHRAVAEIFGFTFSGLFAWWLWRTVYLFKLPRLDRKIRVMLDWTLDLFFPRDITLLNPRFTQLLKEIYLEKGDILFRQGEPAFSLYLVKKGEIIVHDEQGEIRKIAPGEYLGEDALLGDGHHAFDARAGEPSVLVSLPSRAFHQIITGGTSLGRLFKKSASTYESRDLIKKLAAKFSQRIEQKSARDLMTPNPRAFQADMTVDEALRIAKDSPHSFYPLTDAEGRIQGAVHRSDLYEFLKRLDFAPDTKLGRECAVELPMVAPDCTVDQVVEKFVRTGSNKLLVAEGDGRLLGIITLMDLVLLAESAEKEVD